MGADNPVILSKFSGTAREMGRKQGNDLRESIIKTKGILTGSEPFKLMKPWFLPTGLFLRIGSRIAGKQLSKSITRHLPEQWERIVGLSEGSGADLDFLLLLHSMEIVLNKVSFYIPGACSAMGVKAERSADGEPLIIKNFDYPEFLSPLYLARLSEPAGKLRSIEVSAAPIAGNHDGINEAGLAIAYNYGCGQDAPVESIPITLHVQEALEHCSTVAEAVELISKAPRAGGAILMLADARGDMCTLELSNAGHGVRRPENGLIINTNHYFTPEVKPVDVPHNAVYTNKNVKGLRGQRVHESSEARYAQIVSETGGLKLISLDDAIKVFSSHGRSGKGSEFTVCRHGPYYSTTSSVVFLPRRREIRIMWGNPCENRYTAFDFNSNH